jgi:hypothetical protein
MYYPDVVHAYPTYPMEGGEEMSDRSIQNTPELDALRELCIATSDARFNAYGLLWAYAHEHGLPDTFTASEHSEEGGKLWYEYHMHQNAHEYACVKMRHALQVAARVPQ